MMTMMSESWQKRSASGECMVDYEKVLIGALDQGTSSSRFLLFNARGVLVLSHKLPVQTIYPLRNPKTVAATAAANNDEDEEASSAGWTEQDAEILFRTSVECMQSVMDLMAQMNLDPKNVVAIGITNQRETTVAWDARTGKELCNAIVWHDTRTASVVEDLVKRTPTKRADYFTKITGLPFSTYFSASKMRWLLDNNEKVRAVAQDCPSMLRFGTVDSWLVHRLSGHSLVDPSAPRRKNLFVTDVTNASRTHLLDLGTLDWSPEMLQFYGIKREWLPDIMPSSGDFGCIAPGLPFQGVRITACLGDQHAALLGQRCWAPGMSKCTYGTGGFFLSHAGNKPVFPGTSGLLGTLGFHVPALGAPCFALEGALAAAGSAVDHTQKQFSIGARASQAMELAASVSDSNGVYFVPAHSGLFAPQWRADARAGLFGMTLSTRKEHVARALADGIAYQTLDLLEAIDSLHQSNEDDDVPLRVDGGLCASDNFVQILADVTGRKIERPRMSESTALGAALAAGLGANVLSVDPKTGGIKGLALFEADVFHPRTTQAERTKHQARWHKAVDLILKWADHS